MKKQLLCLTLIISTLLLCSCGSRSPYLPLSDVVVQLLEEKGLSNCHITDLIKYKNQEVEIQLNDDNTMEDGVQTAIESLTEGWIEHAEFELDDKEVEAFDGDVNTIKRYLVVGVIGYRKWKNSIPENVVVTDDISRQYDLYERELALSFVTKIGYEEDFTDETPPEKQPGFYYERAIGESVKCYLSDEYTLYNDNKIYITLDESSDFYNKMKEKNEKCLVFEYRVSDPEWYPSVFDFSDGTTVYRNNGMHFADEDKHKYFDVGHILFIGIDKESITDQSFLTFEYIQERFHEE